MAPPRRAAPAEPEPQPQSPPHALPPGEVATALGIATGAAAVPAGAPVVAETAIAQAAAEILDGFAELLRARNKDEALWLYAMLRQEYPHKTVAQVELLVGEEMQREVEFQRRMRARLERDLPKRLAIPDREKRLAAVNRLLERERRILRAREQAMADRAASAVERHDVKLASPEGAFWVLDPAKKSHTVGCVLMAQRGWWPWEVLDEIHPRLHSGCGCHLLTRQEAIERGYLRPSVPLPHLADALATARAYVEHEHGMEEATPEVEGLLLSEARWSERFPKGDPRGGRFKPRGAAAHLRAEVSKLLHRITPPLQEPGTRQGRYVWMRGRYVFVPRHRQFNRKIDHVHWHSPEGSTNIYRNGQLVQVEGQEPPPHHHDLNPPTQPDVRNLPETPQYDPGVKADPGTRRIVGVRAASERQPFPAKGPLPMENGLYYRFHAKGVPFGAEHATSRNLVTDEELAQMSPEVAAIVGRVREGYSAFWNPHHLDEYLREMSWDEAADAKDRRVVAFYGKPIAGGGDGEPVVVPEGKPVKALALATFRDRLEVTPNGYGRWYEHTWGDGPDGQIVDDGYRALGEKFDPALRDLTPEQADAALALLGEQERARELLDYTVGEALRIQSNHLKPVHDGDYTEAVWDVLTGHGFDREDGYYDPDQGVGWVQLKHPPSGAVVVVNYDAKTGRVIHVAWDPGRKGWDKPTDPLHRPPRDWEEWADEVRGVAYRLGDEYDTRVRVGEVRIDEEKADHSGSHNSFSGEIRLGVAAPDALAPVSEAPFRPGAYAGYKVSVHEALHAVNPIDAFEYNGIGKALEEALTEELAHIETAELIRAHGRLDLLRWLRQNPTDQRARGSYGAYRAQLDRVLNAAGIAPELREDFIRDLKFKTPPTARDRFAVLARAVYERGQFPTTDAATDYVRDILERGEAGRDGVTDYHRFVPIVRPDTREFPPGDGVLWNGKPIREGSVVHLKDGTDGIVRDVAEAPAPRKFKLAIEPVGGTRVKHNVLDNQVADVLGHVEREENLRFRAGEQPGIDLHGSDVKIDGKRATIGARVDLKPELLRGRVEERGRFRVIGHGKLLDGRDAVIARMPGSEIVHDIPRDQIDVIEEGPEPQRVQAGDTIRYDGRADGGTSEAVVTQVIPLDPNYNANPDAPRYVIEAITTENSLKPDTLVWLTEERMNGVHVLPEHRGQVVQLPDRRAVAAEPIAAAADPGALPFEGRTPEQRHELGVQMAEVRPEFRQQVAGKLFAPGHGERHTRYYKPVGTWRRVAAKDVREGDTIRVRLPGSDVGYEVPGSPEMRRLAVRQPPVLNQDGSLTVMGETIPAGARIQRQKLRTGLFDTLHNEAKLAGWAATTLYPDTAVTKLQVELGERLRALTNPRTSHVAVRVTPGGFREALRRGRIQNGFEDGSLTSDTRWAGEGGEHYAKARGEWERRVFSLPESDRPEDHPIYGYVGSPRESIDRSGVKAFGEVKVTLKDAVRPRTTIVYSDSNYVGVPQGNAMPVPIDRPTSDAVVPWAIRFFRQIEKPVVERGDRPRPYPPFTPEQQRKLRAIGDPSWRQTVEREYAEENGWSPWRHGDFIEAQIHGGVSIPDDVASVEFPAGYEVSDEEKRLLGQHGVGWRVAEPDPADESLEKADPGSTEDVQRWTERIRSLAAATRRRTQAVAPPGEQRVGVKWEIDPALKGAWASGGAIHTPPITGQYDFFQALHELGHHATLDRVELESMARNFNERELQREVMAWQWAFANAGETPAGETRRAIAEQSIGSYIGTYERFRKHVTRPETARQYDEALATAYAFRDSLYPPEKADPGDYRGTHTAPEREEGASLDNPTSAFGGDDIYGPNALRYFGSGGHDPAVDRADRESLAVIQRVRGRPDAMVTVYRAVPRFQTNEEKIAELETHKAHILRTGKLPPAVTTWGDDRYGYYEWAHGEIERLRGEPEPELPDVSIRPGDWVTLSRAYAKQHGESNLGGWRNKRAFRVLSKKVRAGDLFTDGDLNEWGWASAGEKADPGYSIPLSERIYIAEDAMARAGEDGGEMLSVVGHPYHPTEEGRAESARLTAMAREIVGDANPTVKVHVSDWVSGPGGDVGYGAYDRVYNTVTIRPVSTKLTFLHELAHAMTGTNEGAEGHTPEFVRVAHELYREHLGEEAARRFWLLVGDRLGEKLDPGYGPGYREAPAVAAADVGIHSTGGFGPSETLRDQLPTRQEGHFGTGFYFLSDESKLGSYRGDGRRIVGIDLRGKNLWRPQTAEGAYRVHDALRDLNSLALDVREQEMEYNPIGLPSTGTLVNFALIASRLPGPQSVTTKRGMIERAWRQTQDDLDAGRREAELPSTRVMKMLGYDGVDVRHLAELDHTGMGSVLYPEPIGEKADPGIGPSGPRERAVELTPEEFAAHPRTWWHGTRFGGLHDTAETSGQGFHVGTYEAARQALAAQAGWDMGPRGTLAERQLDARRYLRKWAGDGSETENPDGSFTYEHDFGPHSLVGKTTLTVRFDGDTIDVLEDRQSKGERSHSWVKGAAKVGGFGVRRDGEPGQPVPTYPGVHRGTGVLSGEDPNALPPESRPAMVPLWIVGEMTNTPLDRDLRDDYWANGVMRSNLKRGRARRGMYYRNVSEDEGSVSAVLPDRAHARTHEDFVREAVTLGEHVPAHVLAHYPHLAAEKYDPGSAEWVRPGERQLYHVTRVRNRRAIKEQGLLADAPRRYKESNVGESYLWGSPESAWRYATTGERMYGDSDVWAVRVPEADVHPDPFLEGPLGERAAQQTGADALMVRRSIGPEDVRLHWENPWFPGEHEHAGYGAVEKLDPGNEGEPGVWSVPRDQYVGEFPTERDAKGELVWGQEAEAHRTRGREWERSMRWALSTGKLTIDQATELGFRPTGHERQDEYVKGTGWQPLPERFYHATTAASAVRRDGLKARSELGQERGLGLGGGDDDTISFTGDRRLAEDIEAALREMRSVVRGETTLEDLIERAKSGDRGSRPFIDDWARYYSSGYGMAENDLPPGELPKGLRLLREKRRLVTGIGDIPLGGFRSEEDMKKALGPSARAEQTQAIGNEQTPRIFAVTVPLTDGEYRDRVIDAFKTWQTWREQSGGPPNPLFFSSDAAALADVPPEEIATLTFRPRPGAQGYPMQGMGEWRVTTGDAVVLDEKGPWSFGPPEPEPGEKADVGTAAPPRVYVRDRPDMYGQKLYAIGGGEANLRQPSGAPVRGVPISPDDPRIPDTVYHVTTNLPAVMADGYLRARGEGGLGGDSEDRVVSMTIDPQIAAQLAADLHFLGVLGRLGPAPELTDTDEPGGWRGTPEQQQARSAWGHRVLDVLREQAQREGWDFAFDPVKYPDEPGGWPTNTFSEYKLGDWVNQYFWARDSKAGIRNPIFWGADETAQRVNPEHVGIVSISRENLRTGALLTDFDLSNSVGLREVRSYGDVPVGHALGEKLDPGTDPGIAEEQPTPELIREVEQAAAASSGDRQELWAQVAGDLRYAPDAYRFFVARGPGGSLGGALVLADPPVQIPEERLPRGTTLDNTVVLGRLVSAERGKGTGSRLLRIAARYAADREKWLVGWSLPGARNFWRRAGFTVERDGRTVYRVSMSPDAVRGFLDTGVREASEDPPVVTPPGGADGAGARRSERSAAGPVYLLLEALDVPEAEREETIVRLLAMPPEEREDFVEDWLVEANVPVGLATILEAFEKRLHPRGRGGRWRETFHLPHVRPYESGEKDDPGSGPIRETYRGVKITVKALRGRDWGRSVATVGGVKFGPWMQSPEQLHRSVRGTIDAAGERPDAYEPYWRPKEGKPSGEKADPGTPERKAADVLQLPKSGKTRILMEPTLAAIDKVLRLSDLPPLPVRATAGKNTRGGYLREQVGDVEIEKWEGPTVRVQGMGRGRSDVPAKRADELQPGDVIVGGYGRVSRVEAVDRRTTAPAFGRPGAEKVVLTIQRLDDERPSGDPYESERKPDDLVPFAWKPQVSGEPRWKPKEIRVSGNESDIIGESSAFTLAHEFGHMLDNLGFGDDPEPTVKGGRWESVAAQVQGVSQEKYAEVAAKSLAFPNRYPRTPSVLDAWWQAVRTTAAADWLRSASMMEMSTHEYLLNPKEMWARSFAQWLALRSEEPKLLAQLRAWQTIPVKRTETVENWQGVKREVEFDTPNHLLYRQWQDADFEPVAQAIDGMMERMGWRR